MSVRFKFVLLLSVGVLATGCGSSEDEISAGSETAGTPFQNKRAATRNSRISVSGSSDKEQVVSVYMSPLKQIRTITPLNGGQVLKIPGSNPQATVRTSPAEPGSGRNRGGSAAFAGSSEATLSAGRTGGWVSKGEKSASFNCHGFTFLGGAGTLDGASVATILAKGQYQAVSSSSQVKSGDVVIYRDGSNAITHSGIVVGRGGNNQPRILSKWGVFEMYDHDADVILASYGTNRTYFRSPVNGSNLLDL